MLGSIRKYFEDRIQSPVGGHQANDEHALRLATAALLVEMTRADHDVNDDERDAVIVAVQSVFELSNEETDELIRLAEQEAEEAVSLYQFTDLIDKQFPLERKIHLVEMLWSVAFADAVKDKHEEYLVRRVADLLHVPHREFIRARHRVEDSLQEG